MSSTAKIAFIGAGNMASSIIGGLIANGYNKGAIIACDPNPSALENLSSSFGIATSTDNTAAVKQATIVVLAVKPQVMQAVCEPLASNLGDNSLVISIAAGIACSSLNLWLGGANKALALVRCMPNTPALVQAGASALFANQQVSEQQKQQAEDILKAVGIVDWVNDEQHMDAVTAVSGSGPAYFFLMIEAMVAAGVKQGLSSETAAALAKQTAFGAAKLALQSDVDVDELRRRVTSPNGTTAAALASFENNQFTTVVEAAMQACAERSKELAKELG
ncbi:pyrroline-5-carboxylate reductase [Alteromonadaceae bacterium Bs31]|nr:pyrroline-5-carboxylate reductase [Alteromonadaceae bacterium Bs31]